MKQLVTILFTIILLTGCSKDKEVSGNEATLPELDDALTSLLISVDGSNGILETGAIPFSDQSEYPSILSHPDAIKATASSLERIDLVFEVESDIQEIFFSIVGSSQYYTFTENSEPTSSGTQAVSINIEIPESLDDRSFCAVISVSDANKSISAVTQICFEIKPTNKKERVIYFADFSSNSTLSTLDFNTGEVEDIGSTGFELSDIAFLGNDLYGVTLNGELISIDINSGDGTFAGSINSPNINALEGRGNVLYGATTTGKFLSIDPLTAEGSTIGILGHNASSSGDLIFDANNDFLYATLDVPGSVSDQLATIDPITAETRLIGETGFNSVWGLVLIRNQLIGLSTYGDFIIIDPNSGISTFIENTDAFNAGGAAAIRN